MSRYEVIDRKIREALAPVYLEVEDESSKHRAPPGAQSHFRVLVVSTAFDALALVDRHRTVNDLLAEEFASGLHALSLRTLTPAQWERERSRSSGGIRS